MALNPIPTINIAVDSTGRWLSLWQAFIESVYYWLAPLGQKGTTANRPTDSSQRPLYVGQPYFDTTLGKPIWVKSKSPTVWCDATGASV